MATIYAMTHTETGEAYIGCTSGKIGKRMREHCCLLRAGKHHAKPLQARWNENPGAFQMKPLETLPDDLILKRERELWWMKDFEAKGLLLNQSSSASFKPDDEAMRKGVAAAHKVPGNRWTPEANLKRRLAQLGRPKGHGAKISATKRARAMR